MTTVSEELGVPVMEVYRAANYYKAFSLTPRGRHVLTVCMGTACYVQGNKDLMETLRRDLSCEVGGTTEDKRFSLEGVRCLGCCGIAPVITVDEHVHREIRIKNLPPILEKYE